jgi:hypothetical protein
MKRYEMVLKEKEVMDFRFFNNCKDLSELKSSFKQFSKLLHPDVNHGLADVYFKEMSNDYDSYYKILKVSHMEENAKKYNNSNFDKDNIKEDDLNDDRFKKAIIDLLKKENIKIVMRGVYMWVSGDTFKIKEQLKQLGFFYSSGKKEWFLPDSKNFKKDGRRGRSKKEIVNKYGEKTIIDNTKSKKKTRKTSRKTKKNFIKISA